MDRAPQKVGIVQRQRKSGNAQPPSNDIVGNVHRQFGLFDGAFPPAVFDDQQKVNGEAGAVHDTCSRRRFSKERGGLACGHGSFGSKGRKLLWHGPSGQPEDEGCNDVVDGHDKDQAVVGLGSTLLGFQYMIEYPAETNERRDRHESRHDDQRLELIVSEWGSEAWISHDEERR